MLVGYYKTYTGPVFFSSLLLGVFLGWTWEKLYRHVV